jgi:thiamine pyrophosphate-dependent acetolactate synthase large subunit-like protein
MFGPNAFDVLVDTLSAHGVRRIFGIPGDAINGLIEAVRKDDRVEFVQVRHEEAGALAASAQAKLTGELAVCVGTAGPGALHLLNGLYDARLDHAPVLAVTGQVPTEFLGNDYHQEVDSISVFNDVARYNELVVDGRQMARQAAQACRTALTRRTVAHLSVPEDVGSHSAGRSTPSTEPPNDTARSVPPDDDLERAAQILNEAGKVVVLAGIGASDAEDQLLELIDRLGSPFIKTLRSKDLLHDAHPACLGFLGLLGTRPALEAVGKCDALFMIGTDFTYEDFYPKGKRVVQLDIDPERLGRRCPIDIGLAGHAGATLELLLPRLSARTDTSFLREAQESMVKWNQEASEAEQSNSQPLRPQAVARRVGDFAEEDAVFVCDTGAVTVWGARHLRLARDQRFTLSSSLGSMAFALPGAIGAQFAFPGRQVIALCGDGGFSMLMADFMTAVKYELPITAVIFNNRKLGLIQMEQESSGLPDHKTVLHDMDYAAYARLCGGQGARVESVADLEAALQEAYASAEPWVVDVRVSGEELTRPPKIEPKTALQFGLAKIREFVGQGRPAS